MRKLNREVFPAFVVPIMPILRWLFEVENKVEDKALLILDYIERKRNSEITLLNKKLKNETVTFTN